MDQRTGDTLDVKESHDSRKSGHPRFGHRASGENWSMEKSDERDF